MQVTVKEVVSLRNDAGCASIFGRNYCEIVCFYCVSSVFFCRIHGRVSLGKARKTAEHSRSDGAAGGSPKLSKRRFHNIGAGEGGMSARRCAVDLSGVIRSPVPTGVLVNHVGLRRQRKLLEQTLGAEGKMK